MGQPERCPTDEIGSKDDEAFLKIDGRFGAYFDAVQEEDLLAFLFHCCHAHGTGPLPQPWRQEVTSTMVPQELLAGVRFVWDERVVRILTE